MADPVDAEPHQDSDKATDDLGAKNRGDAEFFCNSLHTRHIGKADAENNRQSRTQMNPAARPDRK